MNETESMPTHEVWFYRAVWALIAFAVIYFGGHVAVAAMRGNFPPTERPPCMEDEPCWDCTTMGNHVCGPRR